MPGVFGLIARDRSRTDGLRDQYDHMARLLTHLDYYQVETLAGRDYCFGRVGIPHRGYRAVRSEPRTGYEVAFDGYLCGWRGTCPVAEPHNAEPVSVMPLDQAMDLADLPDRMDGTFVTCLHDRERDRFWLASSRQSFYRLYYYQDDQVIAFAPEIKAFMGLRSFRREVDLDGVADFFNYGFLIGGRTLYKNVRLLDRATILPVEKRTLGAGYKYWQSEFSPEEDGAPDSLIKDLYDHARDVLDRQVGGRKRIFMALSGGMDSRMVAHFAHQLDSHVSYYCHGDRKSDDARIARMVADTIGVEGSFHHIDVGDDCYARHGALTAWLVDGMVNIAPATLTDVLEQYPEDPLRAEFYNSMLSGSLNYQTNYGRVWDLAPNMTFEDKIKSTSSLMGLSYLTKGYYKVFRPEYRAYFKQAVMPHFEEELRKVEGIGHSFVHEKDVFAMETRIHRLSYQYNLNRFYYHDHPATIDDRMIDMRDQIPINWQINRKLYYVMFQKLLPELARIPYQKTGVDLYSEPSPRSLRWRRRKERLRHLIGRASAGRLNLKDHNTYLHPDIWYRQSLASRRFFEAILTDERTAARGYYDMAEVRHILQKQRNGSNNFYTIASLATFELFNRYFIDGDTPPGGTVGEVRSADVVRV
jgi:asparagine synthase (glutamine-hydrolysing)